jgi:hypothetical protein
MHKMREKNIDVQETLTDELVCLPTTTKEVEREACVCLKQGMKWRFGGWFHSLSNVCVREVKAC